MTLAAVKTAGTFGTWWPHIRRASSGAMPHPFLMTVQFIESHPRWNSRFYG